MSDARNITNALTSPRRFVCDAILCAIPFKVYAVNYGGSFDCSVREMEIGIDKDDWVYTVGILIHETIEGVFALKDIRFVSPTYTSNDSYVFQFDHHRFSDAMEEAAPFLCAVLPKLETAWNRKHKK